MRDPDEDDDDYPPPREERLFGTGGFRRRLSEGLTGLLDPDGALGKGKDYVTGVTQATKAEVVRMVSAEVRNFLDGMDTVELMQQVIAGLVIDVKAEIRFSVDPAGKLKTSITSKESEVRTVEDRARAEAKSAAPPNPTPTPTPSATATSSSSSSPVAPPPEVKKPAEPPRPEARVYKPDKG